MYKACQKPAQIALATASLRFVNTFLLFNPFYLSSPYFVPFVDKMYFSFPFLLHSSSSFPFLSRMKKFEMANYFVIGRKIANLLWSRMVTICYGHAF
jgi:hypothetical protein